MSADGYCNLAELKRLLRSAASDSSSQSKIRFSNEGWSRPEAFSSNQGDGILLGISEVDSSYFGAEYWHFEFTSTTDFTLYRGESKLSPNGNGNVNSIFTSLSMMFLIDPDRWVGTFVAGDRFKFQTNSQMSDDDAIEYIVEFVELVRLRLNRLVDYSKIPPLDANPKDVPSALRIATRYWAAFMVYSAIFSDSNYSTMPRSVRQWRTIADAIMSGYEEGIDIRNILKNIKSPTFTSRDKLFDEIGIAEVAGVEGMKGVVS